MSSAKPHTPAAQPPRTAGPSCSPSGRTGRGRRELRYDLASVLLGGPWGRELRGTAFTRARARVREEFGNVG
jgi:hypothetical protein